MNKIKLYTSDTELDALTSKLRLLFTEFVDIQRHGSTFTFSKHEPGSVSRWISGLIGENLRISLLELAIFYLPTHMSIYKAGNSSFSGWFMLRIISVLNNRPEFLVTYLNYEINKIRNPFSQVSENDFIRSLEENDFDQMLTTEKIEKVLCLELEPQSPKTAKILTQLFKEEG